MSSVLLAFVTNHRPSLIARADYIVFLINWQILSEPDSNSKLKPIRSTKSALRSAYANVYEIEPDRNSGNLR
jgi:hypothetical protein